MRNLFSVVPCGNSKSVLRQGSCYRGSFDVAWDTSSWNVNNSCLREKIFPKSSHFQL